MQSKGGSPLEVLTLRFENASKIQNELRTCEASTLMPVCYNALKRNLCALSTKYGAFIKVKRS